jgi:SulP family sulfate permease
VQGIPVSTSLSASSLNNESGAKTPLASLTTGAIVVLTMLFLALLFSQLPEAVLAAIIIEAVVMGMMDVRAMRRLFRVKRPDFWIAVAALLPAMPVLVRRRGMQVFERADDSSDGEAYPGLLVLSFDAGPFFIDAGALEDRVRGLTHEADPKLRVVVLDFEGVNNIDSQGAEKVGEILDLVGSHSAELRLARVKPAVMDVLLRDGVSERIGQENIHTTLFEGEQRRGLQRDGSVAVIELVEVLPALRASAVLIHIAIKNGLVEF